MDNEKFQRLRKLLANADENNALTSLDMIKLSFKKVFLGNGEIQEINSLWFEKEEIKKDAEYYNLVCSLIDKFLEHCTAKNSFNVILFSKDVLSIIQKTKYFSIYSNLIEISKLFDVAEEYYIDIICSLYILGTKRETPVNEYFIDTLKDFSQDDIIKNSAYYSRIEAFKYEDINENLMKNLLILYNLIINKGDEEKIIAQISLVENPEGNKDQRISTLSTNFENIENEENKFDCGNKSSKNTSPIKDEDNPEENKKKKEDVNREDTSLCLITKKETNENKGIENENSCEKKNEVSKKVVEGNEMTEENAEEKKNEIIYTNTLGKNNSAIENNVIENKVEIVENEEIENKLGNNEGKITKIFNDEIREGTGEGYKIIYSTEISNKENSIIPTKTNIKDEKNLNNENTENSPNKLQKGEICETSRINKENIDNYDSLDAILEVIKGKLDKFKKEEKVKNKSDEEGEGSNVLKDLILPIFQRQNRYNSILKQISILKNTIKEIEAFQLSKRNINDDRIEIEKCLIEINKIKAEIESLKIPSIVNVKRKILDLIIFSILKSNKDKFKLDENYCPNKGFLEKILAKLNDYSQNVLRNEEIDKIEKKKELINSLIEKNYTIIEFPLSCCDDDLNEIMRYLGFCKGKYNRIVHVSKEALKYYLYLPFNENIEPNFKKMLNFFMQYDRNNIKENNSDLNGQNKIGDEDEEEKNEKEINETFEKPLNITFNTAFDFFLKDKFFLEEDIIKLDKKLEEIESKKISFLNKYSDYVDEGWKKLSKVYDKFDNNQKKNNNLDIFNDEEKKLIMQTTDDFENLLKAFETNLLKLKGIKEDDEIKELIDQFFSQYLLITQKELEFDEDKYLRLCETVEGRYVLVFFQIQLLKYQLMDLYSKKFSKILNEYYELHKRNIMDEILALKNQSYDLFEEIKKINRIKSPKKIFLEWKFITHNSNNVDFETFTKRIKSYVNSIKLQFNNDLISDQITSLWLIKNELDQYID